MFLSDNTSEEVSTEAQAIVYIKSSTKIKKADQIEGINTYLTSCDYMNFKLMKINL